MHMAIADAIYHFWTFFQARDMNNLSYLTKFRSLAAVAESHGVNIAEHAFLVEEDMPDGTTNTDDILQYEKISREKFMAHVFLKKACRTRHGKHFDKLHHRVQQQRNGYPDTVDDDAYAMIYKHTDTGTYKRAEENHS
eukprot:10897869-Ditylum_brightwellii.AAC.2